MYAISTSSKVYHLLYPAHDYTLCGFKAQRNIPFSIKRAPLHVVSIVPLDRYICKQCAKMEQRRSKRPREDIAFAGEVSERVGDPAAQVSVDVSRIQQ
jgi:hypothetical protein